MGNWDFWSPPLYPLLSLKPPFYSEKMRWGQGWQTSKEFCRKKIWFHLWLLKCCKSKNLYDIITYFYSININLCSMKYIFIISLFFFFFHDIKICFYTIKIDLYSMKCFFTISRFFHDIKTCFYSIKINLCSMKFFFYHITVFFMLSRYIFVKSKEFCIQ